MGCAMGKNPADRKIDFEFKKIGIEQIDDFFGSLRTLLESCEHIRAGLEDSRETAENICGTGVLLKPTFLDVIKVMFWTLSAQAGGKISSLGVSFKTESPYLTFDISKFEGEAKDLLDAFTTYVKTLIETPGKLKDAIEALIGLKDKVPAAIDAAKAEITGGKFGFKEKGEMAMNMARNAAKFAKNLIKCQKLFSLLTNAVKDFKDIVTEMPKLFKDADTIGAQAHGKKLTNFKEVFEAFHTGERKPVKEAAAPAPAGDKKADAPAEKKAEAPAAEKKAEAPAAEKKAEAPAAEKKVEEPVQQPPQQEEVAV